MYKIHMQKLHYVINSKHCLSSEKLSVETNKKTALAKEVYSMVVTKQHIFL